MGSNGSGLERAYNGSLMTTSFIYIFRIQLFSISEYLIIGGNVDIDKLNVRRPECLDGELIICSRHSVQSYKSVAGSAHPLIIETCKKRLGTL